MPWRNVKKENRDERRLHYIVECSKSLMSRAKKKDAVYAQLSGLVLGKPKKKDPMLCKHFTVYSQIDS